MRIAVTREDRPRCPLRCQGGSKVWVTEDQTAEKKIGCLSSVETGRDLAISSTFVVGSRHRIRTGAEMLRQDNPVVGRDPPPRAIPIRYVLAWKVRHVRRRVRRFRRKHEGMGWTMLSCVIAVGMGLLIGQY